MRTLRSVLVVLMLFSVFGVVANFPMRVQVQGDKIDGRVFDSTSGQGIPKLIVRLTPPKAQKKSERVTRTDSDGKYRFEGIEAGRYLLQVYQGTTLLFRRVIDTSRDQDFVVTLRKKS